MGFTVNVGREPNSEGIRLTKLAEQTPSLPEATSLCGEGACYRSAAKQSHIAEYGMHEETRRMVLGPLRAPAGASSLATGSRSPPSAVAETPRSFAHNPHVC